MTLSKVYFYMIIILCLIFSVLIMKFSEDLKEKKYYKRYLKITILIGFLGVVMELFSWNYLCNYQCVLLTFFPFIALNMIRGIMILFEKVFKKEPFQVNTDELSDGIWVKNKGNLENKNYYSCYTISLFGLPILLVAIVFALINENLCM